MLYTVTDRGTDRPTVAYVRVCGLQIDHAAYCTGVLGTRLTLVVVAPTDCT